MERFELTRTIHQERMRALEVELHRRRLLQPADNVVGTTGRREEPATQPTTQPPTQPPATQPSGSVPRRSSPLTR